MGKIYNGITNQGIIHICIDINIYIIEDNIVALISTTRYIYIYIYIFYCSKILCKLIILGKP